jgi:hypothetical protein
MSEPHNYTDLWAMNITLYSVGAPPNSTMKLRTAQCNMTQTYVELQVSCVRRTCATTAIRESNLWHLPSTATALDGNFVSSSYETPEESWQPDIFTIQAVGDIVNATAQNPIMERPEQSSPFEYYIVYPNTPFAAGTTMDWPILADVGSIVFSQRFAQLLNTYWLAGIAPFAISGNFTDANDNANAAITYGTRSVGGIITTSQVVLECNGGWLVVLLFTASVMLAAGIASGILDAYRRGPDIFDSFAATLRESKYAQISAVPPMEDGIATARRIKGVKVRLGDVRSDEGHGHVAVGTPTEKQSVRGLRLRRYYE